MSRSLIIGFILSVISFFPGMAQQPTLLFPNIDAAPGSTVCFEVLSSNFDSIFTIQFSFQWDPAVMQFVSVQGFGFPNVSSGNFGTTFVDQGKVSFSWFPFSGQPLTLPDGTPVFELCFEVIGEPGESALLTVGSDPTAIEVTKPGSFSNVGLGATGGVLNVVGSQVLELFIEDAIVGTGESFGLALTPSMFNDISSLQTTLSWDETIIQFDSVGDFQLPGLDVSDFDQTVTATGLLGLDWTAPGGTPLTFPDDQPLCTLYFTAIGQSGDSTLVEFTDELIPLEATSTSGISVGVLTDPGLVKILSPLLICTDEVVVNQSDTVCIPLVVNGFDSILSMQFTLQWDTSMLKFVGVDGFSIPYLDLQEFNLTQINVGLLSVSWFDEDFSSKTLPDSTIIFEVCFVAVGSIGDSTELQFVDDPTKIEVRDKNGDIVAFSSKTGTVFIESAIRIVDTLITQTNCGNPEGGGIDIELTGGIQPYSFIWNTGDTTEDLSNIFAGDYSVTIVDAASNTHTLVSTFFVDGNFLSPSVSTLVDTVTLDCKELPLIIAGTGPTDPQYVYEWSSSGGNVNDTLTDPLQAEVTQPGVYILSVTDTTNGCGNLDTTVVIAAAPFPVAEAGPTRLLTCADSTALLDGGSSSVGAAFVYAWSTQDGQILSGESTLNPEVGSAGTYVLSVTDTLSSCVTVSSTEVTADTASPYIDLGEEVPFACKDASVIVTPDSLESGFGVTYMWTALSGQIDPASADQQQVFVFAPGVYQLVVENESNGCIDSAQIAVFADTVSPVVELDTPAILSCVEQQATIQATALAPGVAYEYKWTALTGGSILSGADDPEVVIGALGVYRLVVTDSLNGCKSITDIEVFDDPDAPVSDAGLDTALTCDTDTIQLSGTASAVNGAFSVNWQAENGGNILSGGSSLQPVVDATGTYIMTVTDDVTGCSTTSSLEVVWDTLPPNAEAGQDKELTCIAISVLVGSPTSSQGPQFKYKWTTPNGNFSSADTLVIATVNEPGLYFLQVTNTQTGCINFDSVTVTKSQDIPIVDPGSDRTLTCTDSLLWLGGPQTTMGGDIKYLWSTIDGDVIEGEDSTYALVGTPGEYTLVVTDESINCTSFKKVTVGIDTALPVIELADSFAVDCTTPETILDASGSSSAPEFLPSWQSSTGVLLAGGSTLTPTATGQGEFILTLLDSENGCIATDSTFLSADTILPFVDVSVNGTLNCTTDEVVVDGSGSDNGAGYTFEWIPSADLLDPTVLNPSTMVPGVYALVVTNLTNGCSASDSGQVLIDTLSPIAQIASPDQLTCVVSEVILDGSASTTGPQLVYLWSSPQGAQVLSGQTTPQALAGTSATYVLEVTDTVNTCKSTDTVIVLIDTVAPVIDAGPDIDMGCTDTPVVLTVSVSSQGGDVDILWTGSTIVSGGQTTSPLVQGPGLFTVTVTDLTNGCDATDAVEVTMVNLLSEADGGSDQSLCPGEEVILSAVLPSGSSGNWSSLTGGQIDNPAQPLTSVLDGIIPGVNQFVWTLSTPDCPDYDADTVFIDIEPTPLAVPDNIVIPYGGGSFPIGVTDNDELPGVSWSVSLLDQPSLGRAEVTGLGEITLVSPPLYVGTLTFSYILCHDECPGLCDTALITVVIEQPTTFQLDSIFVPNVITPNGDGANDRLVFDFLDLFSDRYPNPKLVIFNRWGDVLFESESYMNDWDGKDQSGRDLPEGTYYFVLRIKVPDGEVIKGDLTIIR